MIDYSSPTFLKIRRIGQKLGVLRPMVRTYRRLMGTAYEESFDNTMLALVKPGQIVWDIGANVGVFTKKFSDSVGPAGRVLAFEPSPGTFETLKRETAGRANVSALNIALADFSGTAKFAESSESDDPTNSLLKQSTGGAGAGNLVEVEVFRMTDYIRSNPAHFPNLIKVDVEGFEDSVIEGGKEILNDQRLQCVCVEVHFLELNKRGKDDGATKISESLRQAGFAIRWTDPSHIVATRH